MPSLNRKPRTVSPSEAIKRLESLCVKAERCTAELRLKLRTWQITPVQADSIIDSLVKRRFVDDSRFAHSVVHDKFTFERRGRLYLRQYLRGKRIAEADIENALAEIDEDAYLENLRLTLLSRVRLSPQLTETFEGRTRLFRYAVTRGYEPALVSDGLKQLLAQLPRN